MSRKRWLLWLEEFGPPTCALLWGTYSLLFRAPGKSWGLPSSYWHCLTIIVAVMWFLLALMRRFMR